MQTVGSKQKRHQTFEQMSKEQTKDLLKFLKPFGDDITDLVMWLRDFGWNPTNKVGHTICSIAVGRSSKNVHFGFYWGNEISDPDKILLGQGNQYRYILVTDKKKFPKAYMKKLVNEAYANSLAKVKDPTQIISGQTIVKSVSDKKRPAKVKTAAKTKKK